MLGPFNIRGIAGKVLVCDDNKRWEKIESWLYSHSIGAQSSSSLYRHAEATVLTRQFHMLPSDAVTNATCKRKKEKKKENQTPIHPYESETRVGL